jgi:hypothetical protein
MTPFGKHLIYLSYGDGSHVLETQYSVCSVLRFLLPDPQDCAITIYTDHPEFFEGLPVNIEFLGPERLRDWAGPNNHEHRRKPAMLRHALNAFHVPTIAVDGDTYFVRHPSRAFAKLAPGHSVMHIREGCISEHPMWRSFVDLRVCDRSGKEWHFPPDTTMWNGGVEGLHPSDVGIMDEVFALMDSLYTEKLWIAEQFSTGNVFSRYSTIHETANTIFHYWPDVYRSEFRRVLGEIIPRYSNLPISERIDAYYRHRPRPTPVRRAKKRIASVLEGFGLQRRGWRPRISG